MLRRLEIGSVFQFFDLLSNLTDEENVALPLMLVGGARDRSLGLAREALERLDLWGRAGYFPEELSGGEMQRVAIARALVTGPKLVLCDEPTGSLDSAASRAVLTLLRTLPEPGRRSVVMVTHEPQAAASGDWLIRSATAAPRPRRWRRCSKPER